MILDILLIIVVVLGAFTGFRRGLIVSLFDLAGFIIGIIISFTFYDTVAVWIEQSLYLSHAMSLVAGFFALLIIVTALLSIITRIIVGIIPGIIKESLLNKVGGLMFGGLYALLYLSVICWLLINIPFIKSDSITQSSVIAPRLSDMVTAPLGQLIGAVSTVIDDVRMTYLSPTIQGETKQLNLPVTTTKVDEQAEMELFDRVNSERKQRGLKELAYSKELAEVGRKHAEDMWRRQYFSHESPDGKSPFDRIKEARISYVAAGENLALAPSVDLAHTGLMDSPGHKENILYPQFGTLGIGAIDAGPLRGIMFVQVFTN